MIDLKPHTDPLTGLVPLVFLKRFKNINAGETAGFKPDIAQALLEHPEEPARLLKKDEPAPSAPKAKPGEREPKPSLAKPEK